QLQMQGSITIAGEPLTLQGSGVAGSAVPTNVPVRWFNAGPGPINNGQTAGNLPATGRVTAVAVDPTDANVIYIGSAGGGAWKTKNGGLTWTQLFDSSPVQLLELPSTTGQVTLSFNGATTGNINLASATLANDSQAALNGLSTIGCLLPVPGSVTVNQSPVDRLMFTVTFGGALSNVTIPPISGTGVAGTSDPVVVSFPVAMF